MSIQPLSNTSTPAYTPQTANRTAGEATTPRLEATLTAPFSNTDDSTVTAKQATPAQEREAVKEATQRANEAVAGLRSDLKFTIDDDTGFNVVKFIDVKTQEVIRQIPAQEMLVIAKRLDELQGLLIKERV